ncbi:MAG: hypothetical protein BMS9Abin34_411 [Patescibacteria group bacterium]|nr:MAG: hypothetical protein BMS9Abin34_411 [Patescibacteria group bacterium]
MANFLGIFRILISLLLVLLILLQGGGAGLSSAFGGGGGETFRTRRGMEKILFYSTIVTTVLFVLALMSAFFI